MFQRLGHDLQMKNSGNISLALQEEHHPDVLGKVIGKIISLAALKVYYC